MNGQTSLEDVARARESDPETSHLAAGSVGRLTEKRAAVLSLLRDLTRIFGGATDLDIKLNYQAPQDRPFPRQSESGLRTRRAELVELGLVEDSGERVRLPSGRSAIVWRVT